MSFPDQRTIRLATLAGSMLLCGATALAQMGSSPGASPQQTNPGAAQQQSQPGMSQDPSMNPTATPDGGPSPSDKMFVEDALKGGMAEVQLGQLAVQKSSNPDVKQFGQKMVDDHTKMGEQMKTVAQQIGAKVPSDLSKKDKAIVAKLQALNGSDFDKAYMKDMVKDHKADLNDFTTEAQNGSSPVVKNAAMQGSQIIKEHLQMAQQIDQKTSGSAPGSSGQ
jgi:putative membrane protein